MDPASPTANTALFGQAFRALGEGRRANAVAVARAAARAHPNENGELQLANLFAIAGRTGEARAALADLTWPERQVVLADVAMREGRIEEAVGLIEQYLATHPGHGFLHYKLASLLPHLGRFEEANRHAARGSLISCGDLQQTSTRIIRFPTSLPAPLPTPRFRRRVRYELLAEPAAVQAIYVAGCDSRYFLLFGEALANSLAQRAGVPFLLHVHLVNPDPAAEALLERLRAKPPLPIACSRESVDLSDLGDRPRRTYLACARFLVLPELLETYARPMVVADADQLVMGDLGGLLHDLRGHDVALLRDDSHIANLASLISASVLAFNPSPGGRRFTRTVCDILTERMTDPAGLSWHLDQATLAVAHLWHPEISTLRLPPTIMDSVVDQRVAPDALGAKALFWSITMSHEHTARKLNTSLFRQFLDPEFNEPAPVAERSK